MSLPDLLRDAGGCHDDAYRLSNGGGHAIGLLTWVIVAAQHAPYAQPFKQAGMTLSPLAADSWRANACRGAVPA